jgi:hypothetical protein
MGGGSFFMHLQWLNFRPHYTAVYGQVILKLLFVFGNGNKKIALQKHDWEAG